MKITSRANKLKAKIRQVKQEGNPWKKFYAIWPRKINEDWYYLCWLERQYSTWFMDEWEQLVFNYRLQNEDNLQKP